MPYVQKENECWPVNVSKFLISSLLVGRGYGKGDTQLQC